MGEYLGLIFQRSNNPHSSFVVAREETAENYVISDLENAMMPKSSSNDQLNVYNNGSNIISNSAKKVSFHL